MTMQEQFTIQSSQSAFTVEDKLNETSWGPFATEAEAGVQVHKLTHLAELQHIFGRVVQLEESIWDEITLETDASREAKQLVAELQKMVDAHLAELKQEQATRK